MSSALVNSFGSNGNCPALYRYVFATSAGTADIVLDVVGPDGSTVIQDTVTAGTVPKNVRTLLEAAGNTWTPNMIGARLLSVSGDVYWNTSGCTTDVDSDGYTIAPSTAGESGKIAAGSYVTDPYKLGACN